MGLFGALKGAVKAPIKAAQKLPGMGAVNKGVQAAPGVGGMMGKLGLGPSQPPSTVGQALGPIGPPPQQPSPDMQGPPPAQGQMGNAMQSMAGAGGMIPQQMQDPNVMAAIKQKMAMQNGPGIGPSFGAAPQQGMQPQGMMGRGRNPRMM